MQPNQQLLDVLTREGLLVNISVRYWRASIKLNPEDLGLNPDDVTDRLISLGHKKLLPKEKLQAFALIESRAHALIEAATFPFLNGLGHFLPNAKLQEVRDKIAVLSEEFHRAKTEFLYRYAVLRQQAVLEWKEAALKLVADPDRLVATIEAAFPDTARMDEHFSFAAQYFQVCVPESLNMAMISLGEQEEIIQARQEAVQSAREQIHQGTQSFLGECISSLRSQTARLCEEMLESMQTGKTGVHQKTLNRLLRFIEEFKQLNFVGDQEMETQLERVRQEYLTRSAENYRDDAAARVSLEQGLQNLANHARELAAQDTRDIVERFGRMGLRKFQLAA